MTHPQTLLALPGVCGALLLCPLSLFVNVNKAAIKSAISTRAERKTLTERINGDYAVKILMVLEIFGENLGASHASCGLDDR